MHLRHLLALEPRPGFLEGEMSNETKGCTPTYLTGPCSCSQGDLPGEGQTYNRTEESI